MADKVKRSLAFIVGAGVFLFIVWAGGMDFNERRPDLAFALIGAVWIGLTAAVIPFAGDYR